MNDAQLLDPQTEEGAISFARGFVRSDAFMLLFREGMGLVEQTAGYLDGDGRKDAAALPREASLTYATESMRLTTRLMQVASWLLVQRAVRDGEIKLEEAASEKYRLISREQQPAATFAGSDELPEALKALIIRGAAIYERVRRLDETMYETGGETAANPVSEQLAKLTQAFGR